jgi:hypothetical protein
MSVNLEQDPRTVLVRTKYFSLHPKPLQRWLWQLDLPQTAERVFWLHWEEGMRNGDWCSEIPIKRVALECCVDISTVTRSYQVLKAKGLLRREDPGRDPGNPFCQATAITEVRLPREFLTEFSRSPNRPSQDTRNPAGPTVPPATRNPTSAPPAAPVPSSSPATRPSRQATQAMWSRASAAERTRFFTASRDRLTAFEFDSDTQLTPEDRGLILSQLAQLAIAKPTPPATSASAPRVTRAPTAGPRSLTVLDIARTRKRVQETVPAPAATETLRQVLWAVEHGALRRFELPLALNIALKKIREGAWSRPNRMPPNWLPQAESRRGAVPERCSAA